MVRTDVELVARIASLVLEAACQVDATIARDAAVVSTAEITEALLRTQDVFALTSLERDITVLALLPELDERCARAFGVLEGSPERRRPTVWRALHVLQTLHDTLRGGLPAVTAPLSRLRELALLDVVGDGPYGSRELRVADGCWQRLLGLGAPTALVQEMVPTSIERLLLSDAMRDRACDAIAWIRGRAPHDVMVVVSGSEGSGRHALARALATGLGMRAAIVDAAMLDDERGARGLARDAVWGAAAIVIDGAESAAAIARFARIARVPLFVISNERVARDLVETRARSTIELRAEMADFATRARIWAHMLATSRVDADVDIEELASRFHLGPGRIQAAVAVAHAACEARGAARITMDDLLAACRTRDTGPGALAQRSNEAVHGDALVVPPATRSELDLLTMWARHAGTVFRPEAAGEHVASRPGLVALFVGPPGTGKTLAARVIACELRRDLLRVDLSQVVNKYIGETEKNLERVFEAAESDGSLLFFDEADALFGKRTDVRDAHDRYANLETAYLLQRLEVHRGIVILATNLQQNLDPAFLRRIQIVAEFPLPGPAERQAIWARHLAPAHVGDDVDLASLASRFQISGGDIRNSVVTAVVLAASERQRIGMTHLVRGLWRELRKAGRMISGDEFGPWSHLVVPAPRAGTPESERAS